MKSKSKITVLDGYPLNPGDLSWDAIATLGELEIYPRSKPEEVVDRASGAEILIVNKIQLTREVLLQLPELKYIAVTATGYNNIETGVLDELGILVSNIPDYGSFGVAQHAMALLLALTNKAYPHYKDVLDNKWREAGDFSYTNSSIVELAEKKIGLAGLGKIGKRMGVMAEAMGMYVSYYARESRDNSWEYCASFEELIMNADVVSLHLPLTDATRDILNKNTLSKIKPGAILINTSRGELINEIDLYHALQSNHVGGAGLDVLSQEPPAKDHILLNAKNCIITPHNAWASRESRGRIMDILSENIQTYLQGNPVNLIN